jgi:GTPase SAR1 family protein
VNVALLACDISEPLVFQSLSRWINDVREIADKDIVVMIMGNKCDLHELRAVSSALDTTNVTERLLSNHD